MFISELFSKRKRKRERAGQPVIYQYDEITEKFRFQVMHIWKDAIGLGRGTSGAGTSVKVWEEIYKFVSRESGLSVLGIRDNPMDKCLQLLSKGNTEQVLDVIQASFQCIERHFGGYKGGPEDMEEDTGLSGPASPYAGVVRGMGITEEDMRRPLSPDRAIEELNQRFLENDLGYQYRNGRIIRIDSEYTHSEIVLPALQLLNEPEFKPAMDEFLKGHEDYRRGRYEDAINEALKAFESTMKIICENRGWTIAPNATASKLIEICFEHHLIPAALQRHFTSLQSGLLAVRNAYSAHGDGVETVEVPDYLAQYALNLAASNIVLLINAHRTSTGG
jgi:hypothetical protein